MVLGASGGRRDVQSFDFKNVFDCSFTTPKQNVCLNLE